MIQLYSSSDSIILTADLEFILFLPLPSLLVSKENEPLGISKYASKGLVCFWMEMYDHEHTPLLGTFSYEDKKNTVRDYL